MIAQNGSCCISVGLESTFEGPQVMFHMSLGPHLVSGPFFGTSSIVTAAIDVAAEIDKTHYRDFLLTMNDLWPVRIEDQDLFSSQLSTLE